MNTDTLDTPAMPLAPAAPLPATRLLLWLIRRELWENRAIVLAPLVAAGVVLFACLIGSTHVPAELFKDLAAGSRLEQGAGAVKLYGFAALVVLITGVLVAVFYCLDALYGERRDRSILFWKSLPLSDTLTVLSKALTALLVLPLISIAVTLVLQILLLLLCSATLAAHGISAAPLWNAAVLPQVMQMVVYGVLAQALWYAPVAAWLLLVSGWAKRTPILWAVLPPLALCLVERIALGTRYLATLLAYRLAGAESDAFTPRGFDQLLDQPAPLHYLATPGLWLGLLVAAGLLGAAVWLRRGREPI
jgi:ABC-2 type transport system permease protein